LEKKKIIFASVLKPADEVRMYEKLGASLLRDSRFEAIFFGSETSSENLTRGRFEEDFHYSRNPFLRVLRSISFLFTCLEIRPDLIVICTWELILPALIIKGIRGSLLVYDIQENYYKNTLGLSFLRRMFLFPIAAFIQAVENLGRPFFSATIMAEDCYLREMKSFANTAIVLKNKSIRNPIKMAPVVHQKTTLIYCGTISNQTGLGQIENLAKSIFNKDTQIKIIGHCPGKRDLMRVQALEEKFHCIDIQVGLKPQAHGIILSEIERANYCLALYEINHVISDRIPSKFYESLGKRTPVIAFKNDSYETFFKKHGGGILVDSIDQIPEIFYPQIKREVDFHFSDQDIFWIGEDLIFKALILKLLNMD
jgi:hypothetical protein